MKPKKTNATLPRLVIVLTLGLFPLAVHGLTLTWDGDQDGNWNTDNMPGTNWDGDLVPISGDDLSFGGPIAASNSTTNDVGPGVSFLGIAFTNDGTVATQDGAFTLAGDSIILGGNISTTATVEGTLEDVISLDLALDADRSVLTGPGHDIEISGDISGAFTLNLGPGGTAAKGLVTLSGNNTHNLTYLSRSTNLRVESNTALGSSVTMTRGTSLSIAAGLDLTASGGINVTNGGSPPQSITLDEDGATSASINVATGLSSGNYSQAMGINVGADDTLTINGPISSGSVPVGQVDEMRKGGLGTLVLTNPSNSYTGRMRIMGGVLAIDGSGTLGATTSLLWMNGGALDLGGTTQTIDSLQFSDPATGGDTIYNGSLSATTYTLQNGGEATISANLLDGSGGVTKTGVGTLTLTGTNTYTGTTTGVAGSLVAATAAALPGYNSLGMVIFDGGTIGVQVGGSGWTTGEMNDLLTNATKNSGALGIDTTNGDFTLSANFNGTIGLTKLGDNALTLSGNNSYTGNTTLDAGRLNINSATALGDAASQFVIAGGTTIDNTSGSGITLTNHNAVVIQPGGFTFEGTQDLNFGTGPVTLNLPLTNPDIITLNGTGRTLTFGGDATSPARGGNTFIQVDGPGNTLVLGSLSLNASFLGRNNTWNGTADITVNGGVHNGPSTNGQSFIYSGTGTFTIGGASTYFGNTTVNNGTLALASGGSLSDETNVQINSGGIDLAAGVNDTIQSLTVVPYSGGALPDGEYGNTTSGADNGGLGVGILDTWLTGSGKFTVSSATPYETWAAGPFANPFTLTGPTEDPDNDGLSNLLEFVLGGDPTISQPGVAPSVDSPAAGSLVVTFNRSDVSQEAPATMITVQVSPDLTFSTPANDIVIGAVDGSGPNGATYTVGASSSGLQLITVTIPRGGTNNFARVVADQP